MELKELINPITTSLLVIDIQVDYCSPEGKLPKFRNYDTKPIEQMIPRLGSFIEEARKYNVQIIWTRMNETPEHMPENLRLKMESSGKPALSLCTPETPGFEYYLIRPKEGDKEIIKNQYDAFTNPELNKYLHERNTKSIIFTCVYTARCVDSTLRSASSKGYHCIVPEDLVGAVAEHSNEHQAALSVWNSIFAYVVKSEDIIKVWSMYYPAKGI